MQKFLKFNGFKKIIEIMSSARITSSIPPPEDGVRGMTEWNPDKFVRHLKVPYIKLEESRINRHRSCLRKYLLIRPNWSPVRPEENGKNRIIILDPNVIKSLEDFEEPDREALKADGVERIDFTDVELRVENWKPDELLKAVLPKDREGLSSFSAIGHIAHVNLKDHLLPYKKVIGEILLRHKPIKTVVNKLTTIDSTYRNFRMEVLAGEPEFVVDVRESGIRFRFDFSKVYWNPRLSTEHERIVKLVSEEDVIFDVFAGVGPFAIPAAVKRKPVLVVANDLNPEAFKWLQENARINKINNKTKFRATNKDGRDFIKSDLKEEMNKLMRRTDDFKGKIHVIMNLPALAVEFLDAFPGLLRDEYIEEGAATPEITVYVYTFSEEDDVIKDVKSRIRNYLDITEDEIRVDHVRNVAPHKEMMRATLNLNKNLLLKNNHKRIKLD